MTEHSAPPYAPPSAIQPVVQPDDSEPGGVILTDIRISFFRLVVIMIKVSLAAVPAGIIVGAIYLALALFAFGGMFRHAPFLR